MREILFRGKTHKGEWLYGSLEIKYGWRIIEGERQIDHRICDVNDKCENVDPTTIGQYTGLTDKNGKKIFEGDIVAGAVHWLGRMKNGVVTFRDGSFGLIWYRGDIEQFNPFTSMCNVEYEVIGNIHDNPELLKGGE